MRRSDLAAGLATLAAAGAVLLVATQGSPPATAATTEQVCAAVTELTGALDLSSVGDQVAVRAHAAELADLLAAGERAADRQSAQRIVSILVRSQATVTELAEAVAPLVAECS